MSEKMQDASSAQERLPGDVTDGSVDYYDFAWGDPVIPAEESIPCGCAPAQAYRCCCGGKTDDFLPEIPGTTGCSPSVPNQTDDPGYETVKP